MSFRLCRRVTFIASVTAVKVPRCRMCLTTSPTCWRKWHLLTKTLGKTVNGQCVCVCVWQWDDTFCSALSHCHCVCVCVILIHRRHLSHFITFILIRDFVIWRESLLLISFKKVTLGYRFPSTGHLDQLVMSLSSPRLILYFIWFNIYILISKYISAL